MQRGMRGVTTLEQQERKSVVRSSQVGRQLQCTPIAANGLLRLAELLQRPGRLGPTPPHAHPVDHHQPTAIAGQMIAAYSHGGTSWTPTRSSAE